MNIVYKNPEVEYVELDKLRAGEFFKTKFGTDMFIKIETIMDSACIKVFNTRTNLTDTMTRDTIVEPFRNVDIVVRTYGG